MEIKEKPMGAAETATSQVKQSPISQEVLAARLCELSADMANVVTNTKTMVQMTRESVPIQEDMLRQMVKANEDNKILADGMRQLIDVSTDALSIQEKMVVRLDEISGGIVSLVDRISSMMSATEANMKQLTFNTSVLFTSAMEEPMMITDKETGEQRLETKQEVFLRVWQNAKDLARDMEVTRKQEMKAQESQSDS